MSNIKPIETLYDGYRFRSRLEARWAVFFNAAGIKYLYEPDGYENEDSKNQYLPDFYLPELRTHVEVKGQRDGASEELSRAVSMIQWGGTIRRILILGDIPGDVPDDGGLWHFPCAYYLGKSDHIGIGWWFFFDYDSHVDGKISTAPYHSPFWFDEEEGCLRCGLGQPQKKEVDFQPKSDRALRQNHWAYRNEYRMPIEDERRMQRDFNQMTFDAYLRARQARFEHGETP